MDNIHGVLKDTTLIVKKKQASYPSPSIPWFNNLTN